ncbi:MAG: BatD family protein [Prevotella sp.]|nr:BatD family protein [Prevotella sp.]
MKRIILLTGLLVNTVLLWAQVKSQIDPIEVMIGQQAQVTLTVQAAEGAQIEWPMLQARQQVTEGVEVVNTYHPSFNTMVITLTSFDGKLYHLPPFTVKVNGKEQKSGDLALKVLEVEVDTTKLDQYYGPKGVQANPFLWSEWSPLFWLSVVMLLMIAVAVYLIQRLRAGKPIITHIKIVKRLLPHQKAMKEIEQIKADKMVISENQKEYYTKLTDTLRRYIEERYGFSAMEMTSAEIIDRLMATSDQQQLDELRQLFTTADLVKFAKYSTMINENDANLVNAIEFINQTKLENMPTEEVVKPELSAEDQRQQKSQRVMRVLIAVLAVMVVVLLGYVVYSVYQLLV